MTTKSTDPTSPDGFPLPTATRADPRHQSAIVDGSSGDVIARASLSSPDISTDAHVERASGRLFGSPFSLKARRLMRAEQRRAYLDALRSSRRQGGGLRNNSSSLIGGRLAKASHALVAGVVAKGYLIRDPLDHLGSRHDRTTPVWSSGSRIKPKSGATKRRSEPMRGADQTPAHDVASEPVAPMILGDRSAVSDFEAEADRLALPLGIAPSDEVALQRLEIVAADAKDIFPNTAAAIEFLTTRPLDGRGRNGIQILPQKGLPGIISSLDQRRFGYSG